MLEEECALAAAVKSEKLHMPCGWPQTMSLQRRGWLDRLVLEEGCALAAAVDSSRENIPQFALQEKEEDGHSKL